MRGLAEFVEYRDFAGFPAFFSATAYIVTPLGAAKILSRIHFKP